MSDTRGRSFRSHGSPTARIPTPRGPVSHLRDVAYTASAPQSATSTWPRACAASTHSGIPNSRHTSATAPAGYRNLSRLRAAAEAAKRDPKAAVKLYDEITADTTVPAAERDLARVRAASLLVDTETYNNMLQRLEPATGADATFRHTARELLALSAWHANDATAARKWLDMISEDGQTPPSLRSRAEALQALLPPAAKT